VTETDPTCRSLLGHYDPTKADFETLGAELLALTEQPVPPAVKARRWRVPVS
jgi:hypothetical protein